jgi:hypothetical protein
MPRQLRLCLPISRTHTSLFHVKNFLGHKSVKNTETYINIERTLFEPSSYEFTVRVAENLNRSKPCLK